AILHSLITRLIHLYPPRLSFSSRNPPPPRPTPFPYPTLFRSRWRGDAVVWAWRPVRNGATGNAPRRAARAAWDTWSAWAGGVGRSEEHTSELQSLTNLVCRLLLEKKKRETCKSSLSLHESCVS